MNEQYTLDAWYGDNELAKSVLKAKYLQDGEHTLMDLWTRVAKNIATTPQEEMDFIDLLKDWKFIPGGRILHSAIDGPWTRKPTLSNCYMIPIEEDSLEGIYDCLKKSAMVYRTGGGVGTDLSILRPRGTQVNSSVSSSPGVTAFMNLFSESTNAVSQAGRRGALILTLRVDHPDIEDFIAVKDRGDDAVVSHANISVLITDEFMRAVKNDSLFPLRWGGEKYKEVKARKVWESIVNHAHSTGEPGVIFWDTMKDMHNMEFLYPLQGVNPCGEQPLPAYVACNLGSINLSYFFHGPEATQYVKFYEENAQISPSCKERLCETVSQAVRFLDNAIDYNKDRHALQEIKDMVLADRRIGLGITGLADAFVSLGIRYGSTDSINFTRAIMSLLRDEAYSTSAELAREKGSIDIYKDSYTEHDFFFPEFFSEEEPYYFPHMLCKQIEQTGIRNGTLLTVAPVGSGSIIAQTSSGIEPIFATSYTRRVKNDDGDSYTSHKVIHPLIKELFEDDSNVPEYVVTAHDIPPEHRIAMQATIQRYVDASISSTINLPSTATTEDVARIYQMAYDNHLKGVTVFRDGCREGILKSSPDPLIPRTRPNVTHGVTERVVTGDGKLYITINEDDQGVCEVFSTIGKSGGNAAAQSEAISRLISLVLRSGVDPQEIVKELKGIGGPNPVWNDGNLILSTPDAIGQTLYKYLVAKGYKQDIPPQAGESTCPECGESIQHENGCLTCAHCGWSKCS